MPNELWDVLGISSWTYDIHFCLCVPSQWFLTINHLFLKKKLLRIRHYASIVRGQNYQNVWSKYMKRCFFSILEVLEVLNITRMNDLLIVQSGGNWWGNTPPLWRDLVKSLTRKPRHTSSLSLECTDFKNVIFEKNPWAPSEVAEVVGVKRPRNPKQRKF